MHRRDFLGVAAAGALGVTARGWHRVGGWQPQGNPLRMPPQVPARDLVLTCRPGDAPLGDGRTTSGWFYNGSLPGPTLRLGRGEAAHITLVNELPEETITHWHGLMVAQSADGHPRLAIPPGARYEYRFAVDQPAGLYWYHPHTHLRTAWQVHRGLAGLIIVDDPAALAAGLPGPQHELALVLQDRTITGDGAMPLDTRGPAMMAGFFGDTVLVNGVPGAVARVAPRAYRLRILNGSAARIYDLALSGGLAITVAGADGGYLPAPARMEHCLLAPAERLDLVVDFSAARGREVSLHSRAFTLPAGTRGPMMGRGRGPMMMMGRQGEAIDVMRFQVDDSAPRPSPAIRLPELNTPALPRGAREQRFVFSSMGMNHTIDGRSFDLTRPDIHARAGTMERWTFMNDGPFPHPVHLHAAQFLVRVREGGRGVVLPHEAGWKDTVLVAPSEQVTVDVQFAQHRGIFLLHCHNLMHEDMGMMLNVQLD
jgi:FtsP/CotA-like multicopper oxidase with cupredoxin domain